MHSLSRQNLLAMLIHDEKKTLEKREVETLKTFTRELTNGENTVRKLSSSFCIMQQLIHKAS
jgi:hypothetical protein